MRVRDAVVTGTSSTGKQNENCSVGDKAKAEKTIIVMNALDDPVLLKILEFIPPLDILTSVCYVSKSFAHVTQSDVYWRDHPMLLQQCGSHNNDTTVIFPPLNKHQQQRICLFRGSRDTSNLPSSLSYGSVFVSHEEAVEMETSQRRLVCAASTTAYANALHRLDFLIEGIRRGPSAVKNVLLSENEDIMGSRITRPVRMWCSLRTSEDSIEYLLFATKYPLALMKKLLIMPSSAPDLKRLVVAAYRLPLHLLTNDVDVNLLAGLPCSLTPTGTRRSRFGYADQETIDGLLRGQTPVYVSSEEVEIPPRGDALVHYDFPAAGAVANVVTLTLIGKKFGAGGGHTVALHRVDCLGIPLYSYPNQSAEVADMRQRQQGGP